MKQAKLVSNSDGAVCQPQVGDTVEFDTDEGKVRATWLGTVSNSVDLAAAMERMAQISQERQAQRA